MSTLFMARHGETELRSSVRFWGQTDVKLSALGIKQAERLRDLLLTERIDAIYSSDLKRASATAEIIASKHNNTEIITCPELREVSFGEIEGLTFEEVNQRYPEIVKSWTEGNPELSYPGGERLAEFSQRVSQFIPRLKTLPPEQTALIVAHSGSLRVLMCHLLSIGPQHWRQLQLDFASLSMVETHSRGAILKSLNNTSHLGGIN